MSGKSDILARADQCELSGPADEFQVACEWVAESHGAALSQFNFFRVTLDICLDAEFDLGENTYSKDGYSILRSFSGSAEEGDEDYRSVDISLELVEYVAQGSAAQYSVQLEFRR